MKKIFLPLILIFMFVFNAYADSKGDFSKYPLGPSDLIKITVWAHDDLSSEVTVRPDGWISYPLIGEIYASGLNPGQLAEAITFKLTKYLNNPVVTVNVLKYQSKKILVLGEIKKPGLYQYEGQMTVFNAIGLAGGYNKHAELKNVLVVRNASYKPEKPDFFIVNIHKVIHDGNTIGNIGLIPGDIVYVPKNVIGNIADFMDYYLSRIQPAAESYGSIAYGNTLY